MARILNAPPSAAPFLPSLTASLHLQPPPEAHFKRRWRARLVLVPLRCSPSGETREAEPETEAPSSSSSAAASAGASSSSPSTDLNYRLFAGLGGLGFGETAYLTYLKLTDSDAFCPAGGGSCGDVLKSDYASVFGIPLPLIGMVAYATVATLGLGLTKENLPFGLSKSNGRLVLLGITTSMAAASAYFLYLISTKFSGASCSYCLLSALLSFSLLFIAVKDFGFEEIKRLAGLQLCTAGLVVFTLSTAYTNAQSIPSSLAETEIPFFTTEITTPSSSFAISLARHLHSIGAKMYSAFWCSHCLEQKQMFGHEAAKILDYVECFPNGYKKGTKIAKACADVGIEGFPTWVINGEVLSGELEFSELARASGFEANELGQLS